jgi:hypothetical protein
VSRTALATLSVALTALATGPRARAQSVVVGPQANSVSAGRNGLITVPVVANLTGSGGASLGSIAARLTWRPAILTFRGFTLGTAGAPVASADSATGTLRFAVANPGGLTGTPVLINARFEAVGFAGDTTKLNLAVDEITAAGTFANLLGITSATSSLFCVAGGRLGDLDANDVVNSFDALLIVTSAVGLSIAPNTTVNGDVDRDGKVDTRDALIVLSFAVGLPTAPYPVGVLNTAGCTLRSPATVAVTPGAVGVAVGDRFPLAATTRDSVNAIISTGPVTWISRNAAVATVDPLGRVSGVGAGSTRVVAMVSPTVMDSATVTVTGARRVWYVNPVVAAGNPVELGSPAYPFSTIPQAVTAAAPRDTVRVAVASYGGTLLVRKSLVVIGDSTAAGFPRLRNGTGPAVLVDTAGTVRISRLRIEDSRGGVIAVDVDTLDLRAITIERSRGVGISVRNGGYVTIGESSIDGAVLRGIDAESTATVRVRQTTVDLIAAGGGGAPGLGLRAFNVDTVVADTTALTTAGAKVDSADVMTFRNVTVAGSVGPAVQVTGGGSVTIVGGDYAGAGLIVEGASPIAGNPPDYAVSLDLPSSGTVRLDSAVIHDNTLFGLLVTGPASVTMRGATVERSPGANAQFLPVVKFSGVGSVTIAQSSFLQNAYGELLIEDTPGGAATALVDTSTFDDTNLKVFGLASFAMRGGQVLDGYNTAVDVGSTNVVSLVGTEIASTQVGGGPPSPYSGGPWAVTVAAADSLRADSLWIHDNLAGALGAISVTAVSAYGNLLEANALSYYNVYEVKLYQPQRARIAQSVIDDRAGFASASVDVVYGLAGGASVVVDSSTFWGPYYGVYATGSGAGYNDTLVVRGSRMQPGDGVSQIGISVYSVYVGHVSAVGNTLDTTNYGVYDFYSGSAAVRDNVIRNVQYYGVYVYSASQSDSVSGNTIECQPGYYSSSQGVTLQYAPSVVTTANTVRYCATGIDVSNYSGIPYAAEVRGNVVVGDSVYGLSGIQLNGQYTRPVLALNDVSLGRFSTAALRLTGGTFDSARVDSNTVRDGLGPAIQTSGSVVGVSIRGNVIERFQGFTAGTGEGGIAITHTGGGATVVNNRVSFATSMPGVQLYQAGGTITFDSNVVVDGGSSGVQVNGFAVTVTGGRNFVARNYRGFYGTTGTVTVGQSTIQNNTFRGADGVAAWNLANNYWGDPLGPRCLSGCNIGSFGDSVAGVGTFLPFLAAPDVGTPTGAPPAIRPAPARTAAVGAAPLRMATGATRAVRAVRVLPSRSRSPAAAEARRRLAESERARLGTPPGEVRP